MDATTIDVIVEESPTGRSLPKRLDILLPGREPLHTMLVTRTHFPRAPKGFETAVEAIHAGKALGEQMAPRFR